MEKMQDIHYDESYDIKQELDALQEDVTLTQTIKSAANKAISYILEIYKEWLDKAKISKNTLKIVQEKAAWVIVEIMKSDPVFLMKDNAIVPNFSEKNLSKIYDKFIITLIDVVKPDLNRMEKWLVTLFKSAYPNYTQVIKKAAEWDNTALSICGDLKTFLVAYWKEYLNLTNKNQKFDAKIVDDTLRNLWWWKVILKK